MVCVTSNITYSMPITVVVFKNFLVLLHIILLYEYSLDMFCIIIEQFYFVIVFVTEEVLFFCAVIPLIFVSCNYFFTPLTSLLHLSFLLTSSLFCKLATLVRHRIALFGKDGVKIKLIQALICSTCSLVCCFLGLLFSFL